MPWHLSRSDPRKVYDSAHQPVGVMQTPELAALIVQAVNAMGAPAAAIRLQEPAIPPPPADPGLLETFHDDACCKKHLMRAKRTGDPWHCPKCGTEWRARSIGGVIHWAPVPDIAVFKVRS